MTDDPCRIAGLASRIVPIISYGAPTTVLLSLADHSHRNLVLFRSPIDTIKTPNGLGPRSDHFARKAHQPFSSRIALIMVCASLMTSGFGCCRLKREKAAEQMIQARELTYSGIRAEQAGNAGRAETIYAKAVKMSPKDESARVRYAEALAKRGALDEAIEQMAQAYRISHADPTITIRIGELQLEKGDVQAAMQTAERALAVDRKLADAWALKGRILDSANQMQPALESYLRALTCDSENEEVQIAVARTYMRMGKHARALSNLNLVAANYARGSEPESLLMIQSEAYAGMNRTVDSIELLASLTSRPDASATAWHRYGEQLAASGDEVNARLVMQKAAKRFPNEQRIGASLARLNSSSLPVSMLR